MNGIQVENCKLKMNEQDKTKCWYMYIGIRYSPKSRFGSDFELTDFRQYS